MIHRLIRALLALGGSVLLYMAFFLYENERGQIQNRLEELWIAIDDQARKVPGKNAAFLREIVGIASATFDRFFGKKILSWRSVAVSACFSIASYAISCAAFAVSNSSFGRSGALPVKLVEALNWLGPPIAIFPSNSWAASSVAVFFLLLGSLPALTQKPNNFIWPVAAFLGIGGALFLVLRTTSFLLLQTTSGMRVGSEMVVALSLAVSSDFVLLSVDRKTLRWSLSRQTALGPLIILLVNLLLGMSVVAPQFVFTNVPQGDWAQKAWTIVQLTCSANLFTTFIALAILLSAATLLLHRLIWPFVARPLYATSQFGVIRNTKLLRSLGMMFLLGAFPNSTFLQKLKQLF